MNDKIAMDLIADILDGKEWESETTALIAGIVRKTGREVRDLDDFVMATREQERKFALTYQLAHEAGMKAAASAEVEMIQVTDGVRVYDPFPICGFAWVNVKPGTSAFARWLKREGKVRRDRYYGGVTIWIRQFNQSYDRKYAYARAFAQVLNKQADAFKIRAYANVRSTKMPSKINHTHIYMRGGDTDASSLLD